MVANIILLLEHFLHVVSYFELIEFFRSDFIELNSFFILLVSKEWLIFFVIKHAIGLRSIAIAFLSNFSASHKVTPEPQKGSNTISPFLV